MSKHLVICKSCGKQFDANKGGRYFKEERRYMCPACYSAIAKRKKGQMKEQKAGERERATGMRQSMGAMIAKIAIGALFVLSSFGTGEISSTLVGIVIGAALIAWGLLPYLKAKKAAEEARNAMAAEAEKAANVKVKCESCGAMSSGDMCEYCGSPLTK